VPHLRDVTRPSTHHVGLRHLVVSGCAVCTLKDQGLDANNLHTRVVILFDDANLWLLRVQIHRSDPSFARFALAPLTQLHLVKVLVKLLDDPALYTLFAPRSACQLLSPSCTVKLWLVLPTPPRAHLK